MESKVELKTDLKTEDFNFDLPGELIAQYPCEKRGEDKLFVLDRKTCGFSHRLVGELPQIIESGSLLVFNNSKVRKARLYAHDAATGSETEFLLLKPLGNNSWQAIMKKSKKYKNGGLFIFPSGIEGHLSFDRGGLPVLRFCSGSGDIDDAYFDSYGHVPLPPYIKRGDEHSSMFDDGERYQNVYAEKTGSVAAATAGLHFTKEMLAALEIRGIETAFITLHIGMGTFLPVHAENLKDHVMHEEQYSIDAGAADKIEKAKQEGRKIIAVGTTTMRTLESAIKNGKLARGEGSTSIFIYGDYKFKAADALFTNFHTPKSTLLMLVSSFAGAYSNAEDGRKMIMHAYSAAMENGYRFFSYGDAMLII
ncbi:MAG: tRNA preQ1(34) S-adenosylmethionine ribosyltransferase-isomerase QueA [Spirochaetaceae bacterium]|jgi:S-adenosylmethionine:tRNA ribosyltransferase-isomerase|nr:tRNA preQ1(34) S-adenosylmethionine ribosyltransferase-isomerase QueA [Spirochaetaceae bacterium]